MDGFSDAPGRTDRPNDIQPYRMVRNEHGKREKKFGDWYPDRTVTLCFEIGDLAGARHALARLGLAEATLFERREDEGHLDRMEAVLSDLIAAGASLVLTGRAAAIQRLREQLRNRAVPSNRIFTKAYWAAGKTGLD